MDYTKGRNLLNNGNNLGLWACEAGVSVSYDAEKDMYKLESISRTSSRWGMYQDVVVIPGCTLTLSADVCDGNKCASIGLDIKLDGASMGWPATRASSKGNTKSRKSYTMISADGESAKARVYLHFSPTAAGDYAYFSLPKLEYGSEATEWRPAPEDANFYQILEMGGGGTYDPRP